jgi:tetratricopeptide (TPR) repeat protein
LAALLERARTNYAEGAYRDAIRDFALAAESTPSPESLAALVGLVRSAVRSADYQLAYEHSARLAQLAPADATALATHADGFWAIGQFDRSEAIAREAVRLDPRHPRALHALARARFALGHVDEARAHLESALVRDPSDADLFYSLGLLERRAGRSSAAAAAFRKFLTLTPKRDRTARVVWADTEVGLLDALGDRPSELSEPNALPSTVALKSMPSSIPGPSGHRLTRTTRAARRCGSCIDLACRERGQWVPSRRCRWAVCVRGACRV